MVILWSHWYFESWSCELLSVLLDGYLERCSFFHFFEWVIGCCLFMDMQKWNLGVKTVEVEVQLLCLAYSYQLIASPLRMGRKLWFTPLFRPCHEHLCSLGLNSFLSWSLYSFEVLSWSWNFMLLPDRFEDLPKLVEDILQTSVSTGPHGALRMSKVFRRLLGLVGSGLPMYQR